MGMGKTAGDTSEGESAEKASDERAPEGKGSTKAAGKRTAAKKAATEAGDVVTLQGPGFSFEVPAKWTVYAGEAADGRPVAATDKKYKSIGNAESGSGKCTMALYRAMPENDLDDEGTFGSILAKYGTPDMRYIGMVKYYRLPLSVDKEDRVAANGVECLVLRMPSPITPDNYVEYHIRPLAMRTNDLLRVVARDYNKNLDMDAVHALVLQIASSVKLVETDVPECVRDFERLLAEPATAEKANEVMADCMLPYLDKMWAKLDFVSDMMHRATNLCPDGDDVAAAKQFCARSMIEFSNRRFAQLRNFVDVIEKQRELGAEPDELRQMVKECQEYGLCTGVSGENFDLAERTAMQREGVLEPCPDCLAWRERMDKLARELDVELDPWPAWSEPGGAEKGQVAESEEPQEQAEGSLNPPDFVLTMLAKDFYYFPEGALSWNGSHHEFESIHFNAGKLPSMIDELDETDLGELGKKISTLGDYLNKFLKVLEADEGLRVPRARVAAKYRGWVCGGSEKGEGDLTGVTLANLAALSGAIKLVPLEIPDEYVVLCDTRLGEAIPQFYNLVARMIWDLRNCMRTLSGKPFDVSFMLARNFDVDQYFDWPSSSSRPVAGAQEYPGTLHVTEQPVIDLTVEKKPAAKKASAKAKADDIAGEAPKKKTASKKSAAKAKAGEESQAEAADAKQTEKKSPAKKRSAKAEADEKTAPKVQESAEKDEAPAKPKTVEQVMDEVHGLVESGIQAGVPASKVDPAVVARKIRSAWIGAGGSLGAMDGFVEASDRVSRERRNVRRPLGEGDFGRGTTLGKTVDFIRLNGGGVDKQTVASNLGEDAVKKALEDGAVIEHDVKLYLWCQADESGKPMCDYKQAILTLKDQLKSAEAAVLPFDAKKLEELKAKRDEAKRELDNAGFFAFFKKKELKERIASLEAQIPPLEEAQRTHQAVEDIKKKLESTEEAAKKDYKSRGLI